MSFTRIDRTTALGPRLDALLTAQLRLRSLHPADRNHLFEVERAIESLAAGYPTSQSDCVERWVSVFLDGPEVA